MKHQTRKRHAKPFGYLCHGVTIPRATWHQEPFVRLLAKPEPPARDAAGHLLSEPGYHSIPEDFSDVAAQIDEALGLR